MRAREREREDEGEGKRGQGRIIMLYMLVIVVVRGSPLRMRVRAHRCCHKVGEDKEEGDLGQGVSSPHHCMRWMCCENR